MVFNETKSDFTSSFAITQRALKDLAPSLQVGTELRN